MKIYASRQHDLDKFIGKDAWVKCSIDNSDRLSPPWENSRYYWVRFFPYHTSAYYRIKKFRYEGENKQISVPGVTYKHLGNTFMGNWFAIPKDSVHLIYPIESYSTNELFKIVNQTYGGVNYEDLRRF